MAIVDNKLAVRWSVAESSRLNIPITLTAPNAEQAAVWANELDEIAGDCDCTSHPTTQFTRWVYSGEPFEPEVDPWHVVLEWFHEPISVAAYFQHALGMELERCPDPVPPGSPHHPAFTVDTGCGVACKSAIDAAAALLTHERQAHGERDLRLSIAAILTITRDIVRTYVYG